ncbi:hypothetical protein Lesp02_41710 [Lentzea sp. NBRC 105346]|uniref:chromosome partitioning protein n=1 Tax=Lentzea sp. NBRC 105346 TaxID=3032205 RepID=UPI00249FEBD8|nr:chromosome partitioning protein [Lentzea sp. NBRC 105346]GLZ31983.1 hypothetical protein Lesp02_41710 [Lentzea sp. NBRC 105346]
MLVALCSLKGSPGVTTLALALAARWPGSSIVVEADPAGGDLLARFRLPESPGLVSLAAARHSTDPSVLTQHSQVLPGGLRVVPAPVEGDQCRAALSALAFSTPWRKPGTNVVIDFGRIDANLTALPHIRTVDALLVLVRPQDDELARVAVKLQAIDRWTRRPGLVLVGDGYSAREVSNGLGVPVVGRIPRDDKGALALSGRGSSRHGPARSRLGRAAAALATHLVAPAFVPQARLVDTAAQLAGPPSRN